MIRRLSRTLALMGAFSLVPLLSGCVGYDGYDGYYGGGVLALLATPFLPGPSEMMVALAL
ncbi:hypothetical protein JK200_14695, partial [Gluconobacter cerinus]|nr:hypothetical protein [Gluconobacter cerinus]